MQSGGGESISGGESVVTKWSLPASPLDCAPAFIKREDALRYREILKPKESPKANDRGKKNELKDKKNRKQKQNQKLLYEAEKIMRKIEDRSSDDLVDPIFGQFRLQYADEKDSNFEKIYIENNAKDAIRKMREELNNSLKKELSLAEKKLFVSPYGQPLSQKLMGNLGYSYLEAK